MTVLREFIRDFPRFKRQAESGKTVVLVDRSGRRFIFQAEKPTRAFAAGKHLTKGKPLSPAPVPKDEWGENY